MGEVLEKVRAAFDAMSAGDVDRFRSMVLEEFAPDCEIREGPVTVRGAEQILPFWAGWVRAFPGGRFEIVSAVESGDSVAIEAHFAGKHGGLLPLPDGGEVPASGRPVEMLTAVVIRTDGGRVTSWHSYYDQMALAQQLGLAPTPASA